MNRLYDMLVGAGVGGISMSILLYIVLTRIPSNYQEHKISSISRETILVHHGESVESKYRYTIVSDEGYEAKITTDDVPDFDTEMKRMNSVLGKEVMLGQFEVGNILKSDKWRKI